MERGPSRVAKSGVMGVDVESALWMDAKGSLCSGIEGRLPSGTEESLLIVRRVVVCGGTWRGLLISAEA